MGHNPITADQAETILYLTGGSLPEIIPVSEQVIGLRLFGREWVGPVSEGVGSVAADLIADLTEYFDNLQQSSAEPTVVCDVPDDWSNDVPDDWSALELADAEWMAAVGSARRGPPTDFFSLCERAVSIVCRLLDRPSEAVEERELEEALIWINSEVIDTLLGFENVPVPQGIILSGLGDYLDYELGPKERT